MRARRPAWRRLPADMMTALRAMDEMKYTVDHLPEIRRFTEEQAREAGVSEASVGDVVIAVNEVATNAVRHGSPLARLRMWAVDGALVAEVHDSGRWAPPAIPGRSPPVLGAEGGMGLWVARQICSSVDVETGPHGTVVRLHIPLR